MKHITRHLPEFARYKLLDFDLEEIYMNCAVNCIENPYIANYIKKRKQIEDEENTNEREETSQYPPIISYGESGNEEEPSIQPISLIRSSKKWIEPTHEVKKKKRKRKRGKKISPQIMLLLLLLCLMKMKMMHLMMISLCLLLVVMIMSGKIMILLMILKIFLALAWNMKIMKSPTLSEGP